MNMHGSYFSFTAAYSPLPLLDRWFHPFNSRRTVDIKGFPVEVEWTERAERQFSKRGVPITVEVQIYFSCVVKKRVLFHETDGPEATPVTDMMAVGFNVVESSSCDPVEFAKNFPVKRSFESKGASKMHPKSISIDFKKGSWIGEFTI